MPTTITAKLNFPGRKLAVAGSDRNFDFVRPCISGIEFERVNNQGESLILRPFVRLRAGGGGRDNIEFLAGRENDFLFLGGFIRDCDFNLKLIGHMDRDALGKGNGVAVGAFQTRLDR